MSTRANILLLETGNKLWLYHHFDGYPHYLGNRLMKIMEQHKEHKWLNIYDLANEMIKDTEDNGFEITENRHGDIEYLYIINVEEQKITCVETDFGNVYNDETLLSVNYTDDEEIKKWKEFCEK